MSKILQCSMLHSKTDRNNLIVSVKKKILDLDGAPVDIMFVTELFLEFKKFM